MNRLAIWAVFALMTAAAPLSAAQTENQPDQQDMKALASANWFVPLSYANVDFEIPAGSIVEKNSTILAKYPDGTFGVSMANEEGRLEQKIAFEKARMYATQYKLVDPKIEKVSISGMKGAKAVGQLDSHTVTVLILPVDDQQLTAVVMATPERKEWADHFIDSLKH